MKINIDLNTKELSSLVGDTKDPIGYDFEVNLYTESKDRVISSREELSIFSGIFWALCTMLPNSILVSLFKAWNKLAEDIQKGLQDGKKIQISAKVKKE